MNKIIIMGRLTKDPTINYSTGEKATAIGKFNIAVDRTRKVEGQPDADFFNIVAFGKKGEFVEKYLKKGTKVVVSGALQNNNYTDKDGQKVYSVQIVAEDIEFAESKASAAKASESSASAASEEMLEAPDTAEELPFA